MRGQILVFNEAKQAGAILAANGQRLLFHISDWQDVMPPEAGMNVDFTIDSDNRARQLQLALPEPAPAPASTPAAMPAASVAPAVPLALRPKSKSALTLFTLFLGGIGAHRFYMGNWGLGLVQLFGLLFIGILAELLPALGGLLYLAFLAFIVVELVRYILLSDAAFDAKVQSWQAARPGPFSLFW